MLKAANRLVYRIVHFNNLAYILQNGLYVKDHLKFDPNYTNIGNSEIIHKREEFRVKIDGFGFIGDYIPFYFGTQSIMLYNILTGQNGIPKQQPADIVYLCCNINDLAENCSRFFFTDGQANKKFTEHFNDLSDLEKIDWTIVNSSNFRKTEEDPDLPRKYQAEFLVHQHVPVKCISQVVVYNVNRKSAVDVLLSANGLDIPVKVVKQNFYFYF